MSQPCSIIMVTLSSGVLTCVLAPNPNFDTGEWKLEFPPWGEAHTPTADAPVMLIPIIVPLTRHGCGASRYMSMRLATSLLNRRDSTVCPVISTFKNIFEVHYEVADTQSNGVGAIEALLELQRRLGLSSLAGLKIVLGPNGSGSSKSVSPLLTAFGVPQLSWASTSASLSAKTTYPNYWRIVSPDSAVMKILTLFIAHLGYTKCNIAFFDDAFTRGQKDDFIAASVDPSSTTTVEKVLKIPTSGEGGSAVSDLIWPKMLMTLRELKKSLTRIIVALAINMEAYDLFRAAYDEGMLTEQGYVWLGSDGLSGGQIQGEVARVKYFDGVMYIMSQSRGAFFGKYEELWERHMKNTSVPELVGPLNFCKGKKVCTNHPEFLSWTVGLQDQQLQCRGYTALAFDAMVTLAMVGDRTMTAKSYTHPSNLTTSDWMEGMRDLQFLPSYECLSGSVKFNEDQERDMPVTISNWQDGTATAVQVASWSGGGVDDWRWQLSVLVKWPGGLHTTITDVTKISAKPSGRPLACLAGAIFNTSTGACVECMPGSIGREPVGNHVVTACEYCSAGKYASQAGQTECKQCDAGRSPNAAQNSCLACVPGRFTPSAGFHECELCASGQFSEAVGHTACVKCAAGRFSNTTTKCEPCPPGTFSESMGRSTCAMCAAGKSASQFAQSYCPDCLIGSFTSGRGQSRCEACSKTSKTTMQRLKVGLSYQWVLVSGSSNESDCICAFGYRPYEDTCIVCEQEGLRCEGDTVIDSGFYADVDFSVYQCRPPERCKGGTVGSTCMYGRTDIACARCKPGMTMSKDGSCAECEGSDTLVVCMCIAIGMLALIGIYYAVDSKTVATKHSSLIAAIACSQLVALSQLLSVISRLMIDFPYPLSFFLQLMGLLAFDVDVLRLGCVAHLSPLDDFVFKIFLIFIVIMVVLAIHCCSVICCYHGKFRSRFSSLVAMVGTMFSVFFISVFSTVILPLQCDVNPNGKWTVQKYGSVVCWESDEHIAMLVIGAGALQVPLGFLISCVIVVRKFPSKLRAMDTNFLKAYSFMFARVNPDTYWYGLVIMSRSLLISLVSIIPDVSVQIVVLQCAMMILLIVGIWYRPWRVQTNNYIDIASSASVILFMSLAALFVDSKEVDEKAIAWICALGFICFFFLIFSLIPYGMAKPYMRKKKIYQFFLCHHKLGAGAYTRMLKMFLLEQPKIHGKIFVDCDDLTNLETLFDTVGSDVECLVVIASKSVLVRPWCVGEVTTAHLRNVTMRILRLPDFKDLDSAMIDSYDSFEGLEVLARSGIGIEMIKSALRHVQALPTIVVPAAINSVSVSSLASKLAAGDAAGTIGDAFDILKAPEPYLIMCDTFVYEASAAALVLQKFLLAMDVLASIARTPDQSVGGRRSVRALPETISTETIQAIALFNNGCLDRVQLPTLLIMAARQDVSILPLLIEEAFRVPSDVELQELIDTSPVHEFEHEPGELADILAWIFKQIAKEFLVAMDSEIILRTRSRMIADNIVKTVQSSQSTVHTQCSTYSTSKIGSGSNFRNSSKRTTNTSDLAFSTTPTDEDDQVDQCEVFLDFGLDVEAEENRPHLTSGFVPMVASLKNVVD